MCRSVSYTHLVGIMMSDLVHERFVSVLHWRQLTVLVEALILLGVGLLPPEHNTDSNTYWFTCFLYYFIPNAIRIFCIKMIKI